LVSSHLMSEMAVTADHLVIIGRGRLLADTTVDELIASIQVDRVRVRSPQATELRDGLVYAGATVTSVEPGHVEVSGLSAKRIGELAFERGLVLHELTPQRASLEQAYMELTRDSVEYRVEEGRLA
jgi:ABC-2 type transport system ATP-binding protein